MVQTEVDQCLVTLYPFHVHRLMNAVISVVCWSQTVLCHTGVSVGFPVLHGSF